MLRARTQGAIDATVSGAARTATWGHRRANCQASDLAMHTASCLLESLCLQMWCACTQPPPASAASWMSAADTVLLPSPDSPQMHASLAKPAGAASPAAGRSHSRSGARPKLSVFRRSRSATSRS